MCKIFLVFNEMVKKLKNKLEGGFSFEKFQFMKEKMKRGSVEKISVIGIDGHTKSPSIIFFQICSTFDLKVSDAFSQSGEI